MTVRLRSDKDKEDEEEEHVKSQFDNWMHFPCVFVWWWVWTGTEYLHAEPPAAAPVWQSISVYSYHRPSTQLLVSSFSPFWQVFVIPSSSFIAPRGNFSPPHEKRRKFHNYSNEFRVFVSAPYHRQKQRCQLWMYLMNSFPTTATILPLPRNWLPPERLIGVSLCSFRLNLSLWL